MSVEKKKLDYDRKLIQFIFLVIKEKNSRVMVEAVCRRHNVSKGCCGLCMMMSALTPVGQ